MVQICIQNSYSPAPTSCGDGNNVLKNGANDMNDYFRGNLVYNCIPLLNPSVSYSYV